MEIHHYLAILRRRWLLVAAVPLLAGLLSLGLALARPPAYGLTARLLVTRGAAPQGSDAGLTDQREDKTAQDLPAIVSGAPFAQDVAGELAAHGRPMSQAAVQQSLGAANDQHVVYLSATTADPADAALIADVAVMLIKTNGLRYWGETRATPANPGLNVAVLDLPTQATRLNGPRAIAIDVVLRVALGFVAGAGIAFALHYLEARPAADHRPPTTDHQQEEGERGRGGDDRRLPTADRRVTAKIENRG
jgi:capsular polysaccharide biosynthesis protein